MAPTLYHKVALGLRQNTISFLLFCRCVNILVRMDRCLIEAKYHSVPLTKLDFATDRAGHTTESSSLRARACVQNTRQHNLDRILDAEQTRSLSTRRSRVKEPSRVWGAAPEAPGPLLSSNPSFSDVLPPTRTLETPLLTRVSCCYHSPTELLFWALSAQHRDIKGRQGSSVSRIPRRSGSPMQVHRRYVISRAPLLPLPPTLPPFLALLRALVGLSLSSSRPGDVDLPLGSLTRHSRGRLDGHSEFDSLLHAFVSSGNFGTQLDLCLSRRTLC